MRARTANRAIRDARGVEGGVRVGLNGRMLAASLLLAAIVAAAFAVLVLAIGSLRSSSRDAQRADQVAAAANDLERLAIDLETGERGFVVTGRQSFLRPWEEARREIPAKERALRAGLRDPARRERERELEQAIDRYLRTWSVPTVTLARADLAAAVGEIATGVGKRQMDLIRALFSDFLRDNDRLSASRRDRATSAGDRAVLLGVVGLAGSTVLILVFGGYFARAVVTPVRRLARAAGRLGAGDLSTRVPEAGAAEIGELARAFNRMAASLERTRSELESQNAELDAFTYSVSHDLRAPLRAIDGFSRLLQEDYADALPPEGRRYLGLVGKNTRQMGQLIDGLLSFSRLSKQQLGRRAVDMRALAEEVLAELAGAHDRPGLRATVGPLPPAQGDPVLLRQVLANLLSNAYKYTGAKGAATIEVGAYEEGGETVYFVRDDGVGFDMRYASKLFQVFQRLHRAEDYEGTGLGLALVARIVKRHGGRVWADAKPGEGATFSFTLGGEGAEGEERGAPAGRATTER